MSQTTSGYALLLTGILVFLGALFNWRVVVGEGKLLSRLLGVFVNRIITAVGGFLLFGFGIGLILGWF